MKRSSLVRLPMMVLVIALFSILLPQIASAQPAEEWNKTYGGTNGEVAYSVQQTSDGGYIVAGITYSYGAGDGDVYLIKTDSEGIEEWNQIYGGPERDVAISVQQTLDGGYIITGVTYSFGAGDADIYLVKTDPQGVEEWSRTYGGQNHDMAHSVQQTSDGGYIIAGVTSSFGCDGDFYLVKTDSQGVPQWSKNYGGSATDGAYSVQQTSDEGYIVAGGTRSFGAGDCDFYLVKTDRQGKAEWSRNYGEGIESVAYSVQQTSDGGYIAAGLVQPIKKENKYPYLVKTDSQGRIEWSRTYDEISLTDHCVMGSLSLDQTFDGGYILAARTKYRPPYLPCYLIKIDSHGLLKWKRAFYAGDIRCIHQTTDGGYIVAGSKWERPNWDDNFYLAKLSCEESTSISPVATPSASPVSKGNLMIRRPPFVNLYIPQTHASVGEELIVYLSVLNPVTSPGKLVVNLSLDIPKGWSVTSSGFAYSPKNSLWTASYEIRQGPNPRAIYVHVLPNKPGQRKVYGYVNYYFADHPDTKISERKKASIAVYPPGEKPFINIYMPKTEVNVGEEMPLYLSISNPSGSPGTLMIDFHVMFLEWATKYWSIESSGNLKGIHNAEWENTYKVSPGTHHRVIELPLLAKEPTITPSTILVVGKYLFAEHPETIYTIRKVFYMRSLPITSSKTKQPTSSQSERANEPYIDLYGHKVDVSLGEEIILSISAINPVTSCDTLNVQLTLVIPSGWSVTTSGFNYAGAGGLWTSSYEIEQGANPRAIYVHVLPNEPSQQTVFAHIDYYFTEEPELKSHIDKELYVVVHPVTSSVEYGNGWLEYPKRLVQIIKQAIASVLS